MKKIALLLVFSSFWFFSCAQRIAIPLFKDYEHPLYSLFFTSSNSFIATVKIDQKEYVKKFSFSEGKILDQGFASDFSNVAVAGQINGKPYLYLKDVADVVPGYPDATSQYFTTHTEEVFVGGYMENLFVIARSGSTLDICRIKKNWRNDRYESIPVLSDPDFDENGIHVIGDSIFFSRKDAQGYYSLYKSVRNQDMFGNKEWSVPEKLGFPYNVDKTNTLFYLRYEGVEYITSDRNGIFTLYAIGTEEVLEEKFGQVYTTDASSIQSNDDYSHELNIKVGGKIYEGYVNVNGYSFYNSIIDLDDPIHVSDIVYIKEVPEYMLNSDKVIIMDTIKRKNGTDWYVALFKKDTVTLLPIDIARKHNLNLDENLIKKENIINKEDMFLVNAYVVYSHSLDDDLSDPLSTDQLKDKVLSGNEFSEEELIHMFSRWKYAECYVQLGFYTKRLPSVDFTQLLLNRYTVTHSPRMVNGVTVGTQYYVECSLESSFAILEYSLTRFNHEGIDDEPFIRIGKWDEKFTIIKLREGRYFVEYDNI